jgi:hypothetical protein
MLLLDFTILQWSITTSYLETGRLVNNCLSWHSVIFIFYILLAFSSFSGCFCQFDLSNKPLYFLGHAPHTFI